MDGRDSLALKNCTGAEIVGLGQDGRVIFRTTDPNVDLFDQFIVFNGFDDQKFWICMTVLGDDENRWEEADLAAVEYFLTEDFGFDDYDVGYNREFGDGFPRSLPAVWSFECLEREDEP